MKGNALITFLFFMAIGITVITSATLVLSSNMLSTSSSEQGVMAYYAAESGIEDGYLRLLRDPDITPSPYLIQATGSARTQVTITNTLKTGNNAVITATGTFGSAVRKLQLTLKYATDSGVLSIDSWKEVTN